MKIVNLKDVEVTTRIDGKQLVLKPGVPSPYFRGNPGDGVLRKMLSKDYGVIFSNQNEKSIFKKSGVRFKEVTETSNKDLPEEPTKDNTKEDEEKLEKEVSIEETTQESSEEVEEVEIFESEYTEESTSIKV